MVLSTIVKIKALGLAKQMVLGSFINGALIGAITVALAANATRSQSCKKRLCGKSARTDPVDNSSPDL